MRNIGTIGFTDERDEGSIVSTQDFGQKHFDVVIVVFQLQLYFRTYQKNLARNRYYTKKLNIPRKQKSAMEIVTVIFIIGLLGGISFIILGAVGLVNKNFRGVDFVPDLFGHYQKSLGIILISILVVALFAHLLLQKRMDFLQSTIFRGTFLTALLILAVWSKAAEELSK